MNRITHVVTCLCLCAGLMSQSALASDCQQSNSSGTSEVVGTVVGAVIGGLLGSRIGSGSGKKIAIGAGVLAGGFLGNRIGSMTCKDQKFHQETAQSALETQPAGTASSWQNPDSGHAGSVTPTRTWQRGDGQYCRDFEQIIEVDGREERATGTACRESDGTWRMVQA